MDKDTVESIKGNHGYWPMPENTNDAYWPQPQVYDLSERDHWTEHFDHPKD